MKHRGKNGGAHGERKEQQSQTPKKEPKMHTAFRVKATVKSSKLEVELPELELISGREVEVIIIANGVVEDGSKPSEGRKNSSHVAGSIILDDEALRYILSDSRK